VSKPNPKPNPTASTLKTKRRRKPIFIDEPIQWHLRTTEHDRCSWCGLQEIWRQDARRRRCDNGACGSVFRISIPQSVWFNNKTNPYTSLDLSVTINPSIDLSGAPNPRGVKVGVFGVGLGLRFTLQEAQLRSDTGRGFVCFHNMRNIRRIYWHRQGHLPEREDARPACAGGSALWRAMLDVRKDKVWLPDQPLNEMEVIAKAYGTDEPMF